MNYFIEISVSVFIELVLVRGVQRKTPVLKLWRARGCAHALPRRCSTGANPPGVPRSQTHRRAAAPASAAVLPASGRPAQQLEAFAEAASGEYEGVSATFDARGAPLELPEQYVPAAYREWEVQLHDWQTQCSVEASPAGLAYTLKRLLPTVGVSDLGLSPLPAAK